MRTPRVAYLVLTYLDPARTSRLVNAVLESDLDAKIMISHNREGAPGALSLVRPGTVEVRLVEAGRGGFPLVKSVLDGLRAIQDLDWDIDYVVLLSGQDHPCRSLRDYKKLLLESGGDGDLDWFSVFDAESPWSPREADARYRFRWAKLGRVSDRWRGVLRVTHALNRVQPWVRVNISFGEAMVGIRGNKLPSELTCYGGSMWWTLSWRAVQHLLAASGDDTQVVKWARRSRIIDESYVQTVLVNSGLFRFSQGNRRFISFEGTRHGHPRTLGVADVPKIVASNAFFCRKVADVVVLDALDAVVRRQDDKESTRSAEKTR